LKQLKLNIKRTLDANRHIELTAPSNYRYFEGGQT
jgi:hypothetical protein